MKTETTSEFSVAASLAGEDVSSGDYVSVLTEICECPSFFWSCDGVTSRREELVRLRIIPDAAGTPLRVFAVCLPFIYAKSPLGKVQTLDLRKVQIVKLDRGCAKAIWKEMQAK